MKKLSLGILILMLILMLICLSLSITAVGDAVTDDNALIALGDYNKIVIALHQRMSDLGLYSLRPESPWGPASVESLKVLQGVLGVEQTGVVGSHDELEQLLAAEVAKNTNLATGTDESITVAPVGSNNWCNPTELYPTSEYGLALLKSGTRFTVSFDWTATGVDTAVDASISLRYTGPDKTWYAAVGHFALPVGDNSGHCDVVFEPTDDMRDHGTGWLIGDLGKEVNRDAQIILSSFYFWVVEE